MKTRFLIIIIALLTLQMPASAAKKHTFQIKDGNFLYDGRPIQIHSGEIHYPRVPAPYWRHRLKMAKAMGLNAVTTYVFWNYHEVAPGKWDWSSGNHNLREFIKTAADEGLLVILRPGPYVCAEWEFGGYPWWLQKVPGMVIRTMNQPFLDSCRTYINQLAAQVKDLQITHGGPIVMVQAENEFGSYVSQRKDIPLDTHKQYSAAVKQMLIDAGFDVNMFTSDGSWLFKEGTIDGALPTANGENDVAKLKKVVDEYNGGKGPYMVAEFYPGWLQHWAEHYNKVSTEIMVKRTKDFLDNGINFNYYMFHGGTNFAFTSGANYNKSRALQPDLTSYDYNAPLSEAGWPTEKYMALRQLIKSNVKYNVPEVPERIPVISIKDIKLSNTVNLFDIVETMTPVESDRPMTFEDLGQGHGYVLYRHHIDQFMEGILRIPGLRDYATIYINGERVATLNRVFGNDLIQVSIPAGATLDILVENMGRINYGAKITENLKGIIGDVTMDGKALSGSWQMYRLPMSEMPKMPKIRSPYKQESPTLYFGEFTLDNVGDTFLDMEKWGKGIVFVNGVNLGRYWRVGPQQTLYLPGCFLKKGQNTIVVFEQLNDERKTTISGVTEPVLEKLML